MFTQNPKMQKRRTRIALLIASCGSLMLAGCSAEAEAPPAESVPAAGSGILETSAGRYEFTPTTCAFYEQDGAYDIELRGPGTTPDGEKLFFELSSTANALTIGLGVDRPYASPERQLKAGRIYSQEFDIVVADEKLTINDLVLVNEDGAPVGDGATLSINCSTQ
ncbi:hypothetical protein FHS77_001638 [Paenochrobactrum gallinarii]|uniref:Lipoprotein n=1 Tax=Paenochrobactrum gallinarii TaxID=643673 RepID=A0A841LW33_9HYPH|nr:hypothetical protein [Paenochrobactrum gallinarii]MBB6261090.1 hypothetical protein [Paenochrobactrum gallinarii]